jgi:hypothetical protein
MCEKTCNQEKISIDKKNIPKSNACASHLNSILHFAHHANCESKKFSAKVTLRKLNGAKFEHLCKFIPARLFSCCSLDTLCLLWM